VNAVSSDDSSDLVAAQDAGTDNPLAISRISNIPISDHEEVQSVPALRARTVTVRGPTSLDAPAMAALFSEMQRHYRRPVTDTQAREAAILACQPIRAMFDPRVLVAEVDGAIVGSIVLNVTFPAFELSRSLYIRDLYVASSMRRRGVGQALVQAAAHLTYAQGFSAIDWTTETSNTAARQMYESCGARVLPRTYYRLAREDMTTETESYSSEATSVHFARITIIETISATIRSLRLIPMAFHAALIRAVTLRGQWSSWRNRNLRDR
jgi:ribosomal protein S18 acetylase RimI-like enzyme